MSTNRIQGKKCTHSGGGRNETISALPLHSVSGHIVMSFPTELNLSPAYCLLLCCDLQEMKYRELLQPEHILLEFLFSLHLCLPILLHQLEKTPT